ncbi:unnamed protein product [Nezara viridula]|uniref:phosphoinositide 5-phosphatase n=1 Tax=Nezara viridula TaxID=85310 RepID=A0A9P0HNY7_NEZVI|nr:unnamed protein product [Nezara viridula]
MGSVDLLSLVQSGFTGETVLACLEVSKMQGWVRTTRYLAIISKSGSSAFFVLTSTRVPPISPADVSVEGIVPIDSNFKFELDTETQHEDGHDLYLSVSSNKSKLLFEMMPSSKSNAFVGELYKAVDNVVRKSGPLEYNWLNRYPPVIRHDCSDNGLKEEVQDSVVDSPDSLSLPRESIAKGSTPIAARESVIRYMMSKKEDQYMYKQSFRIFVGTWNVNGQSPTADLTEWLSCDVDPPDIYAIGFQELDLSTEAFLFNDTPRENEWYKAVVSGLHNGAKYTRVKLVRLVGMMLVVFVQEKLRQYVTGVACDTVGTGIMGKMGNKGGVGVRLDFHSTSICFVNAHLAAHVEEYERRNQDYRDIYSRMCFSSHHPPKTIKDHDHIYWLGDLNYRITEIDPKYVKDCVERDSFQKVLEYDQLIKQCRAQTVFVGFKEGSITFKPTYKYDTGTDNWDSSEKNRAPAWCDRILWKGESIEQIEYRSHPFLKISDHKPVSSLFDAKVRIIDAVKYRKIHEEVMKKLDKLENEFLPQVTVETTEITFDTVQFLVPQSKNLIIANTGQVPVKFEFIKKLDDPYYCKDWLNIEPYLGDVIPGEKCEVKVEVRVDKKSAYKLNSGQDQLYDILVLHLEGGKDIFITVSGNYERSCFGTSLETLASIKEPIREISLGSIIDKEKKKDSFSSGEGTYAVPKEVWFLVDHLYRHGTKAKHLFVQPGLHSEIYDIRDWLDNGSQESLPGSVYSVAEALLLLFESCPEPVIPYEMHTACLNCASNFMQCKQIIQGLTYHRKNVFIYLCSFLRELLSHSDDNGLDTKTLAALFGGIFMRDKPVPRDVSKPRSSQQQLDRKKSIFIYHFLVNDYPDLLPPLVSS